MAEAPKRREIPEQAVIRVLRIGILQDGKIIHERLIKPGQSVTIGESEKNTFVFKSHQLPKRHTLVKCKGEQHLLCFTDEMSGMIALPGGVVALKEARTTGTAELRGDSYVIPLNSKSRGKVVIGEMTVLFQYVAAPPESARLVSRQNFRPVLLEDDDPVFLGFLALWGALGALLLVYALNAEKVDLVKAEDLPDLIAQLANPTVEEETETTEQEVDGATDEDAIDEDLEPEEDTEVDTPPEAEEDTQPRTQAEQAVDNSQRREAAEQAASQSTLLGGSTSVVGTAGESEGGGWSSGQPTATMAQQASGNTASPDLGGPVDIGVAREGIEGEMATTGATEVETEAVASGQRVTGGSLDGNEDVGDSMDQGTASKVTRLIKARRNRILDCYNKELSKDPTLAGKIVVKFDVFDGETEGIVVTGMSSTLQSCVKLRVSGWKFDGVEEAPGIELSYTMKPSN